MEQVKESILVIDDDEKLCELLSEYLVNEGFIVDLAHDSREGTTKALSIKYSLIILDVMLPGGHNGFTVLQNLRMKIDTPVLMLTARGEDVDRIIGLEMGADDYLPKPFNPRELLARIHAILRRIKTSRPQTSLLVDKKYKIGDVELNYNARTVSQAGKAVEITIVEFNLLDMLMQHAGELVTRDELAREVLGRPLSPYDRSVDVHVSRLRKKLNHYEDGTERIKSVRGSGYIYITSSFLAD
ncbi:MAG: response regulator transcription factor [Smithella sp.]